MWSTVARVVGPPSVDRRRRRAQDTLSRLIQVTARMDPDSPKTSETQLPSVAPPKVKKPAPTQSAKPATVPDIKVAGAEASAGDDVAIASAAPVHRQYLDRTTTTSVITLGYRPTRALTRRVYLVGMGLAVVALVAALPALSYLSFSEAPIWARLVLLTSAVQLAYVGWMCLVPDWSTVRITMFVGAGVAAAYGFVMAVAIATPPGAPTMFDMDPVRSIAVRWCAMIMALLAVATFFSGRLAFRWRKGYMATNGQ